MTTFPNDLTGASFLGISLPGGTRRVAAGRLGRSFLLASLLALASAGDGFGQVTADGSGELDPRLLPSPAAGPVSPSTVLGVKRSTAEADSPSTALMITGGILGGGIGVLGGGYLGKQIGDEVCEGSECLAGVVKSAFIGAATAESVLLPLGVHLGAGTEGDFGSSLLTSAALGAAAVGVGYATDAEGPIWIGTLVVVPAAQLTLSILKHR